MSEYNPPDPLPPPLPIFNNVNWIIPDVIGGGGGGGAGFQGAQGLQGFGIGSTGSIGPQGPIGFQGFEGLQGLQGDVGFQGEQGFDGPPGPPGVLNVGTEVNTTTIASNAGTINQGIEAIAIGESAGNTNQAQWGIGIGKNAGQNNQGLASVAIGYGCGQNSQGDISFSFGINAGNTNQGIFCVSIGDQAAFTGQGQNGIAIGQNAGRNDQGTRAIAIGYKAGETNQPPDSIILNATNSALDAGATGFYVKPIRLGNGATGTQVLSYDNASGEIQYIPQYSIRNWFGQYQDTTSQPNSGATGTTITFNTIDFQFGISLVSSSRITFENRGYYSISYSLQYENVSNTEEYIDIWVEKNGTPIPNSTGIYGIQKRQNAIPGKLIASSTIFFDLNANDYLEFKWTCVNIPDVRLLYVPAGAFVPASPSIILNVQYISG